MATDKLVELKARAEKLGQMIKDSDTKKYLLELPNVWLGEAEAKPIPGPGMEFMLSLIEQQLSHVEKVVAKYGPNWRITGEKGRP